ncbi:MAG: carboxypeptidase-like regulatory domain-containing protein [Candidatus Jettenia sp. CY-1]|nr:MAG: carboxypeptidase-like regulatory domain-containing protein [Candidatus Jettenia sp. CY-1]
MNKLHQRLCKQKVLFLSLACLCIILTNSCTQLPRYRKELNIIVSPHKLSVHSGSEDTVFVTLLNRQGEPLTGIKIEATSTSPTVATVTPEALTDTAGKAIFSVKGISPGTTKIIISVNGYKTDMEVVFIEH